MSLTQTVKSCIISAALLSASAYSQPGTRMPSFGKMISYSPESGILVKKGFDITGHLVRFIDFVYEKTRPKQDDLKESRYAQTDSTSNAELELDGKTKNK